MTLEQAMLDIFSGQIDENALWIESVEGFSNARGRMLQLAAEKPGRYFVFSPARNSVLAETETSAQVPEVSKAKGTAA